MRSQIAPLFALILTSFFASGFIASAEEEECSGAKPSPANPLPAWTQEAGDPQSDQQFLINTKIFEISRRSDSTDIPAERYEQILTDQEFQIFVRGLSQMKGADIMTSPSVFSNDGDTATVEVTREFVYPSSPAADAEMKIENTGVTLYFNSRLSPDSQTIALKTFTRVSEFDGFADVSPDFQLPVFVRRDIECASKVEAGETLIVGGILDETELNIEEAGFLNIGTKRSTETISRELIIAVTVTLKK